MLGVGPDPECGGDDPVDDGMDDRPELESGSSSQVQSEDGSGPDAMDIDSDRGAVFPDHLQVACVKCLVF